MLLYVRGLRYALNAFTYMRLTVGFSTNLPCQYITPYYGQHAVKRSRLQLKCDGTR